MDDERPGYTDTPLLPGGEYHVHDPTRPPPRSVQTGAAVSQPPPGDATVLFDGAGLDGWEAVDGGRPAWTVDEGELVVEPGADDLRTTGRIGDCQLHVEWATSDPEGEYPGNSGVFLADRYEIQILDNRNSTIYADGYAGAVYGQHPPAVDASTPPGRWNSFDIVWHPPRFEGDTLQSAGRVTVLHNGVLIQDHAEVFGPTSHQQLLDYEPHPPEQPLRLQDHNYPVRFRNIWWRPLD